MNTKSIWAGVIEAASFTPLLNDLTVDVAFVGGGITAAYLLARVGKRVAVLEAWNVARGSTGFSRGNLYAPAGEHLYKIEQSFKPGDEKITELHGDKVAAYRDEDNPLPVVSAICPHMNCVVHFNAMYRTWDCPCHGSRFTTSGEVIESPAYDPLASKEVRITE